MESKIEEKKTDDGVKHENEDGGSSDDTGEEEWGMRKAKKIRKKKEDVEERKKKDVVEERKKQRGVWKFFMVGSWYRGANWKFSHNLKLNPCKYLHSTGRCKNGSNWTYSHERLEHDQINAFIKENEVFLDHLFQSQGYTNLGEYYIQYKNSITENQN